VNAAPPPLEHPLATRSNGTRGTVPSLVDQFGRVVPATDDPAFQKPTDPLADGAGAVKQRADIVHREIPLTVVQTGWTVPQVRQAIEQLVIGQFDAPSQLVDAIGGDSRVQSAMASRVGGLLGRPMRFTAPPALKDDKKAKRCLDAWREAWTTVATEPALSELQFWTTHLAFCPAQLLWDTSDKLWIPHLAPWQPRYVYYHWTLRTFVAVTLDGQVPITPGDGHWVLHAPHGAYRGWLRGAMRAIAPWWLARNYALRDWARYSERHGMPILLARTPFGADKDAVNAYKVSLGQLGQESVIQLPGSVDLEKYGTYDLAYLETKDPAWEGFRELIVQCNAEITLALLGQNLTTEVKEGSFAAARVHADVRQAILEADARALAQTVYRQMARPFAAINFGDPNLAPRTEWDVAPYEDEATQAQTFQQFANAVFALRRGGYKVKELAALARDFGLRLGLAEIEEAEPIAGTGGGGARARARLAKTLARVLARDGGAGHMAARRRPR
jgi:phage gp29-like protein